MLDENVNICVGCLIALVNAMGSVQDFPSVNEHIMSCLKDLKNKNNVEKWISVLREDKKLIVPDCFVCMNPCGRTCEIYVNELHEDNQIRALALIDDCESLSMEDIFYGLGSLPYNL